MSVFTWCTQRAGGLSVVALLALSYWVISQEIRSPSYANRIDSSVTEIPTSARVAGTGILAQIFAYYSLFVHIMVFLVPIRACRGLWDVTASLKRAARIQALSAFKKSDKDRRTSSSSFASSETLTSNSPAPFAVASDGVSDTEAEISDIEDLDSPTVIHAIVIPNYKEELDILRETLDVLASHPQAAACYDVYLGMEQREIGSDTKALGLIQDFAKKFRHIDYTCHPSDIPGESAGKGSNIGWAARKLSENYPMEIRKRVLVTGIDADSHLSSRFFSQITSMHLSHPETASTTTYAAPIIFDRNAHTVAAIVRVADILWCAAGISGLYRNSTIAPPTSVYALPLELVDRVGGWDTNAEAIGEDLHMFIKCFFAVNGNLTCRTVMSPVSQTNVSACKGGGIRGSFADVQARYKQALRHMWGSLDSGFAIRKVFEVWRERKHTTRAYPPLHKNTGEGSSFYIPENQTAASDTDATASNGIFSDVTQDTLKEPHWERITYLMLRLYEAHFVPTHMMILVLASGLYMWAADGKQDPHHLGWIFTACNVLRTLGFMFVAVYLWMYESYHRICVRARETEMRNAGLDQGMCFSHRSLREKFIDYGLIPLVAPIFGSIPAAQAELTHFWTAELTYTVSKKATRQRAKSVTADHMA